MIRKYQTSDTDTLIDIWRKANALAHAFLPEQFVAQVAVDMREIYLPNAQTWVMENEGLAIGFIALIDDEIGGLFLDPEQHGKGFGRAMVDHAVSLKGPLRVEVFEKNRIGRRFYDAYGFTVTDQYRHEPTGELTLKLAMGKR